MSLQIPSDLIDLLSYWQSDIKKLVQAHSCTACQILSIIVTLSLTILFLLLIHFLLKSLLRVCPYSNHFMAWLMQWQLPGLWCIYIVWRLKLQLFIKTFHSTSKTTWKFRQNIFDFAAHWWQKQQHSNGWKPIWYTIKDRNPTQNRYTLIKLYQSNQNSNRYVTTFMTNKWGSKSVIFCKQLENFMTVT